MVKVFSFSNNDEDFGFFQKDEGNIIYFMHTRDPFFNIEGSGKWSKWEDVCSQDGKTDCASAVSPQAISYFIQERAEFVNVDIVKVEEISNPGVYYNRLNRGNVFYDYRSESFLKDVRAYRNIQLSLDVIFNYIEPSKSNSHVYGSKIRELLILSCAEVECLLVEMLLCNGYKKEGSRYSTIDYVKCNDVLGLKDFEVELVDYPSLKTFKPFCGWDESKPTQSLSWYDAYNSVKHNRSENINHANLDNLLDSMAAIHVILEAQYGAGIFRKFFSFRDDRSLFRTIKSPRWECSELFSPVFYCDKNGVRGKWEKEGKYFEDFK